MRVEAVLKPIVDFWGLYGAAEAAPRPFKAKSHGLANLIKTTLL
jgi:hypothetical protein